MIVKSISHKGATKSAMKKLIDYIFLPEKLEDAFLGREPVVSKRYIRGFDTKKWISAFKMNDDKRNFEHRKRTVLRHEIISFSHLDNHSLTPEKLRAFSKWYLKHRSPTSMGVCAVHYEEAIHIHFVISAVGIDKKSTRISREDFKNFKLDLQAYQQTNFPELSHSIIMHDTSKKKASKLNYRRRNNT